MRLPHRFHWCSWSLALPLFAAACHEGDGPGDDWLARAGGLVAPSIEGTFEQRIATMDDGTERITYHVRTPDGFRDLLTDETIELPYKTQVRAWGEYDDEQTFALDELEVLAYPPTPLIDPEPYPFRRIATVLLFWNQPGLTNATAENSMFISADSTNVYYGENSYGKETIAGDVFGPYEISDPGSCNTQAIADAGMQQFVEHGHDPDEFRQFMWHFPQRGDCGFSGLATSGNVEDPGSQTWYNGSFDCVVRAQEIGHNYGMSHSHSYNCPAGTLVPVADECSINDYGDPYDPMGHGCYHMNVAQKAWMGWLEGCNVVTTTVDGTFNIVPTELPCDGTQALRFPSYDEDKNYYLEYRKPLGVDANVEGVLLHWASGYVYTPATYIIPAGIDADGDPTYILEPGDTFTDPMGVVSFTLVDVLDTHAVVEVTFPDGGSGEPTCADGTMPGMAGGNVGVLECADEPFPLDTSPPTVVITYPADGAEFTEGSDFTITAEAMDDRNVTEAELYLQIIGVDDEPLPLFKVIDPPYEYDVTDIPVGKYLFGFVVRDGPNQGVSEPIIIDVVEAADTTGGGSGEDSSTTDAPQPADTGDVADSSGADSSTGPGQDITNDGCGCTTTPADGSAWALLGFVGGWCVRRRRYALHTSGL